jgi:hypothetical protein
MRRAGGRPSAAAVTAQAQRDPGDAGAQVGAAPAPPGTMPGPASVADSESGATATRHAGLALRLPSPRVSTLLVLAFVGFGAILGAAAGSPVSDTLASGGAPVRVVVATAAPPSPSTPAPAAEAAQAPPTEAQPTPAPAPAPAPSASTPAPTTPQSNGHTPQSNGHTPQSNGHSQGSSAPSGGRHEAPAGAPATKLPPVKHVFVIMLSDQPYAAVFGPESHVPYVSRKLERQGELLPHYDAVAHEQLANEVALLSGQGPTPQTASNCPEYAEITPATFDADEQVLGDGCVYPRTTETLAGQLTAKRLKWRAYVQGIDEGAAQPAACAHPALGQADPTSAPGGGTGAYATFRNPFVYFASVVGSPACATSDVGLHQLTADLASAKATPSLSYIVPDRCHDAEPTPCAPGAPAGPSPAGAFLEKVVPEITRSPAYKQDGLLVITTDQAPSGGELADSSSCCGQPVFPNVPATTPPGLRPGGGGTVGALLLSPFVKAATTNQEKFNHFSLLRTIEDIFNLGHIGYASLSAVTPLQPAMFTSGTG